MNKDILEYLNTQRISVLAVEMPDGSPHAATVHFAHTEEPFLFIFETYTEYRKSEALLEGKKSRASLVVGFHEENPKTLQLDGEVSIIEKEDPLVELYLNKFPEKKEKAKATKVIFFTFTPTWWRFTDFTRPEGKLILVSDVESATK